MKYGDWEYDPKAPADTWPQPVQEFYEKHVYPYRRDPTLCGFGDWKCQRRDAGWLCGGFPDKRYKPPFWTVNSLFTDLAPVIETPTQQLKLFEQPGIILWWKDRQDHLRKKRQWWIASYHCRKGADWAIQNERDIGAYDVRVMAVRRKSGCKYKTVSEPYQFCE